VCDRVGDPNTGTDYRARANALVERVEAVAWDGEWYLRAYDDDGHPLGSAGNDECKIDLNAQTWSVLADAPDEIHRLQAMRAVKRHLMNEGQILRLLTPPFQRGDTDPGYIKGYPPGVRENGAQYSHAAVWAGFAFGKLGDGDSALEVARCLNPVNHSDSPEAAAKYRVEPYVVAADIYSETPNVGRGGWSWYTGAAAWTYRLVVEVILGIRRRGDAFEISPCLPRAWEGYQARLHLDGVEYQIRVVREGAQQYRIYVNDELLPNGRLAIATQSAQDIDAHAETLD
jgi:cyclic beta-1,2-glucan synthetase